MAIQSTSNVYIQSGQMGIYSEESKYDQRDQDLEQEPSIHAAVKLLNDGQTALARRHLEGILKKYPGHREAMDLLDEIEIQEHFRKLTIRIDRKIKERDFGAALRLIVHEWSQNLNATFGWALNQVQKILHYNPTNQRALIFKQDLEKDLTIYNSDEDIREGEEILERIFIKDLTQLVNEGEFLKAVDFCEQFLESSPNNKKVINIKKIVFDFTQIKRKLLNREDVETLLTICENFLKEFPKNKWVLNYDNCLKLNPRQTALNLVAGGVKKKNYLRAICIANSADVPIEK